METLAQRAALLRESLGRSQASTDAVVGILGSFDSRLSALDAAMRPIQLRTHAVRTAHQNIDRTLRSADVILTQFDRTREAEREIQKGPHENLQSFLDAVDRLRSIERFFSSNRSYSSSDRVLSHVNALLSKALVKMEGEFQNQCSQRSKPMEPDRLFDCLPSTLRPSSESRAEGGKHPQSDNQEAAVYSPPALIEPKFVPLLAKLAQQLVQAGCQQQCGEIYSEARASALESSLKNLGVEKLSKDEVQKMPWEILESKIGNWIHFMRIAVKLLFAGERQLCDQVFECSQSLRDKCFSAITKNSLATLLSFGEAIAMSKRSPEKLFVLLDMYEIMCELQTEIDTIFVGESCSQMRDSALSLTKCLAQTAQKTFSDFEEAVEKDATKNIHTDGTVHPLTSYVINYVKFLFETFLASCDSLPWPPPPPTVLPAGAAASWPAPPGSPAAAALLLPWLRCCWSAPPLVAATPLLVHRLLLLCSSPARTLSSQPDISQVVGSAQAAAEADEHYDPFKDPKRRPAKSKDPAWKYAFWPDLDKRLLLQCNLCGKKVSSGPCRMKKHLAGGFTIVDMCPKTTPAIRKEMHEYLRTHSHAFKNLDEDEEGGEREKAEASSKASNSNASGKRKSEGTTNLVTAAAKKQGKSIADQIRKTPEEVIAERRMTKGTQRTMKEFIQKTKEQKDIVDDHVADFLYENCLPLNIINSRSWEILLESIGQYGSDYISPSYHQLREPLLEKAKVKTDSLRGKHEAAWKEYGCSLMSDGWTDMTGRHFINFLVNSPEGTFFLGAANVSSETVDAKLVAKLLSEQIDAIGPELVVQVVSDNGSNYKAAGRLLMEKYPTLYWTPCAAHCVDLMLEDIGKIKEFSTCIAKAKRTTRFIYSHGKVLDLMRRLNHKQEIVRPGATRFATSFLTLASMWKQRQILKALFVSSEWYANKLKDSEGGKAAEATVISVVFWQSVECCMRASQPLLRALRIADGDETMAEMWAAMDFAKTHIKEALSHKQNLLGQVLAIVDRRWDNQMEQKLHGAALFLNPSKFFAIRETNKRQATRLRSMFNDVLWKMVPDDDLQATISREADDYERTEGECFTKPLSIKEREKKSPLLWWSAYGGLAFDLQTLAKRIISLCCSASGCEGNWSVFAHIHTKGRNRLEYKRLNKLSYVSYNRQMEARFQNLREQGSKSKKSNPLILEEFQWDNEWVDINAEMVHEHQAQVMDGDTPLLWSQVDEAMGASTSLAGRSFPRRARGDLGEPIARPIGPYITYTRNHSRTRLVVHDEELRAELEAAEYDKDMESNDEDDDDSPNDQDAGFQLEDMDLEA